MFIQKLQYKLHKLNTAQIITLSFAGVIFVGGLILWLPICAAAGQTTSFTDAMFTATTCVCVTGLVTGTDIAAQCRGALQSGTLAVPEVMLRDEKDRFLDDVTPAGLGESLGCRVITIPTDGAGCCKAVLGTPRRKRLIRKPTREES